MTEIKTASCIVISDNHGDERPLWDVLSIYGDEVDTFIHCGDSESEASDPIWKRMHTVKGNMDGHYFPEAQEIHLGNKKVFVTHGHLEGVKRSLKELTEEAQRKHADIVCFGHSHIPFCEKIEGIIYVNPGSISLPKGPEPQKTYARLTVEENQIRVDFFSENHDLLETKTYSEK